MRPGPIASSKHDGVRGGVQEFGVLLEHDLCPCHDNITTGYVSRSDEPDMLRRPQPSCSYHDGLKGCFLDSYHDRQDRRDLVVTHRCVASLTERDWGQAQAPAHEVGFGGVSMMERFKRMTPPFFKMESDPILVESWLRETEKILHAIRCAEEERVMLATYMLQERANGSKSVLEYEARFAELSKYAPHIVADERRNVKKFIMGVKPSLRTRLIAFQHRSIEEALSEACMQEVEMEVYLEEMRASLKRSGSAFQHQDRKKNAPAFQ
ncbi:hypothetical protein Taro_045985 [Colocasia esculenta]|uniref:Retrotransposon gag domain-containing protein n=1 Tax=Colocasia esculenta TaxID=4460 RepID=A0A843X502_COLES|nr:hypothetical protein [Colocasia esculenta]